MNRPVLVAEPAVPTQTTRTRVRSGLPDWAHVPPWIAMCIVGWAVSAFYVFLFTMSFIIPGLVTGIATSADLVWLLRHPREPVRT
jgi:hypothetical protein